MHCFLISTLAEYQTRFWAEVGADLLRRGHECVFISFDDRSTEMLKARGFTVYSLQDLPHALPADEEPALLNTYDIRTPERWFLHERVAYHEQDPQILRRKLCDSIRLAEIALSNTQAVHKHVSLIQEVGGFLSVVGCFYVACHHRIPNWFIEPAFFKGRLFYTQNSFAAPAIGGSGSSATFLDVQAYLQRALEKQQIVIPEKDRHHYSSALKKILNLHNLIRLFQKSVDKYLLGKKQEFGYIGRQVLLHARMLINSYFLRNSYTPLSKLGRFIYFPLHVPGDMALTIRSPEYVDQLSLIEHIVRTTPLTHRVAVKEHPAMIGALDARRLMQMSRRYPQLKIIHPATNNYDVIRATELVVSINSKSGAEALLLGKQVVALGEAFYSTCPLVHRLHSLQELAGTVTMLLETPYIPPQKDIVDYFHAVWDASVKGELYVAGNDAIAEFTDSLIKAVGAI